MSDVYAGVVLRRPVVALEVPVFGPDKKVVLGLALNPTTDAFNEILRRQRLPEPWVLGLYDGRGAFVARSRDGERVAGQSAGPLLLPRLLSDREGLLDTVSRDGVPVLTAFSRIDSFGWTAAVSVPLAEIAAPAWRSALRTLAAGLVSLLAGLGLALLVARRITGPIASLRDLAAAPDNDRPHAVATTGLAEVDEVAEALVAGACARRAAAAALRESEFRLRLALDASQFGIWLWEAGGGGPSGDARSKALFGLPPEARIDYETWAAAIEPEDRPAAEAAAARALSSSDPHDEYDHEYRVRRPDGKLVWLHATGRATFEPDPAKPSGRRAVRILGTILDVTERRAAIERQRLLLREVDHRATNALAVALSLVRLAPRDDAARFAAGVEGRIAAMARAHSLLAEQRCDGADFHALAKGELAAYADRVELEGPPTRLSADAAQPLAMLLHELATNAAKHGALSAPAERVALRWGFERGPGDAEGWLRLRWAEAAGRWSPVPRPAKGSARACWPRWPSGNSAGAYRSTGRRTACARRSRCPRATLGRPTPRAGASPTARRRKRQPRRCRRWPARKETARRSRPLRSGGAIRGWKRPRCSHGKATVKRQRPSRARRPAHTARKSKARAGGGKLRAPAPVSW